MTLELNYHFSMQRPFTRYDTGMYVTSFPHNRQTHSLAIITVHRAKLGPDECLACLAPPTGSGCDLIRPTAGHRPTTRRASVSGRVHRLSDRPRGQQKDSIKRPDQNRHAPHLAPSSLQGIHASATSTYNVQNNSAAVRR